MKLFRLNSSLTSFTYPIIKIAVCVALTVFCIERDKVFHVSSVWGDWLVTIFATAIVAFSILCFFLSVFELFCVVENKRKERPNHAPTKPIPLSEIFTMSKENDIIEIEAQKDGALLTLGTSAVSDYGSSKFTDKKYYIGATEYETFEEFAADLQKQFPAGYVQVYKIDGVLTA